MSKLFRTQVWFCRTAVRLKLLHFRCCRRCIAKIQPNSGHKLQRDTVWNWSSLMHLAKSQRLRIYSCWLHTHVCLLNDAVPKCQSPKSHSITMFFTHSLFWDKPWEILDSFKYPISAVPSLSFRVISSFPWAFWLPLLAEQKMDMFKKKWVQRCANRSRETPPVLFKKKLDFGSLPSMESIVLVCQHVRTITQWCQEYTVIFHGRHGVDGICSAVLWHFVRKTTNHKPREWKRLHCTHSILAAYGVAIFFNSIHFPKGSIRY